MLYSVSMSRYKHKQAHNSGQNSKSNVVWSSWSYMQAWCWLTFMLVYIVFECVVHLKAGDGFSLGQFVTKRHMTLWTPVWGLCTSDICTQMAKKPSKTLFVLTPSGYIHILKILFMLRSPLPVIFSFPYLLVCMRMRSMKALSKISAKEIKGGMAFHVVDLQACTFSSSVRRHNQEIWKDTKPVWHKKV